MRAFFMALLGTLVAFAIAVAGCLLLAIGLIAIVMPEPPTSPKNAILVLDLNRSIPDSMEEVEPGSMLRHVMNFTSKEDVSLGCIIKALERAAEDDKIKGVFLTGNVQSRGFASGPAAIRELRQAIQKFKESSGKPVIAYNHTFFKSDLYLATAASKLYLDPFGSVDVAGLTSETLFLSGALKKYGVDVQVTRAGKYKSAVEPFLQDKMSEASREQTRALLNDVWGEWKQVVAAGRGCDEARIQTLADEKGSLMAEEALQAGMVDKLMHYDQVLDELKVLTGKSAKAKLFPQVNLDDYARMGVSGRSGLNRVAVLYAEGEIVGGEGRVGQVGGGKLSRELRELRLDEDVKAVVLRVNSPGGSATASELIAREVRLLRAAGKPVVISMGNLAASGGYWISMDADRIIAQPNTVTGSIGVFGLQLNIKKLASDHGFAWDGVQMARMAPATLAKPLTPSELNRLQTVIDSIYGDFLNKVASGRKLDRAKVASIAEGRVWSGKEALKLGLVDELGGMKEAVGCAAKLAKIEKDYHVDPPGLPRDPFETFFTMVKSGKRHRSTEGPADSLRNQMEQGLRQIDALNDPKGVYLLMPMQLEFR